MIYIKITTKSSVRHRFSGKEKSTPKMTNLRSKNKAVVPFGVTFLITLRVKSINYSTCLLLLLNLDRDYQSHI